MEQVFKQLHNDGLLFQNSINQNSKVFTQCDHQHFKQFMEAFWEEQKNKIIEYFSQKYCTKSQLFDKNSFEFAEQNQYNEEQMKTLLEQIKKSLEYNIMKFNKKTQVIEHMVNKNQETKTTRRYFNYLKQYYYKRIAVKQNKSESKAMTQNKLMNQIFISWRNQTYKSSYDKKLKKNFGTELMKVQQEYQDIINQLEEKIKQTEELIKTKKQAESEFTYSIQRNILKTIGNLQLEVQKLGQVSQEEDIGQKNKEFITHVKNTVQNRLNKIDMFKNSIVSKQNI